MVPHAYYRVFMTLSTGQRHCVIFCGQCASPAGKTVPVICVVWIDQQEYALTFYSPAVTSCTTWFKMHKFYVMHHILSVRFERISKQTATYALYRINRLVIYNRSAEGLLRSAL